VSCLSATAYSHVRERLWPSPLPTLKKMAAESSSLTLRASMIRLSQMRKFWTLSLNGWQTSERTIAHSLNHCSFSPSYRNKNRITGIIYLYDISQRRVSISSHQNAILDKLCGLCSAESIALVTTMWSEVNRSVGNQREHELSELYWKQMVDRGSRIHQYRDTYGSAWDIVTSIVHGLPVN
jgi:hypothetical protein